MEDGQHIARLLPGRVWAAAKRLSKKLRLRAIALDKRLWASHSKFCWQFLILSLCASLRRRLRAEGPGGAEDYGAGCSDRRICLLFDVTPHQIPHEEETLCGGEGGGAAVLLGPSGEMARGDTSHHATPCLFTVPTVWPGQLSWGRCGGKRGQCPPLYRNSHPGHSQKGIIHIAWGAISLQHNPEWEIKPRAAQT